jgi:hypothetical protein
MKRIMTGILLFGYILTGFIDALLHDTKLFFNNGNGYK